MVLVLPGFLLPAGERAPPASGAPAGVLPAAQSVMWPLGLEYCPWGPLSPGFFPCLPAGLLSCSHSLHPCSEVQGKTLYPTNHLHLKVSLSYWTQGRLEASCSPNLKWKLCECHSLKFSLYFLQRCSTLGTQGTCLFSAFHRMHMCLWSTEHSYNYPDVVVEVTKVQSLNDQLVITCLGFRTAAKIQTLWGFFYIPTCSIWLAGGQNQGEVLGQTRVLLLVPLFTSWPWAHYLTNDGSLSSSIIL